MEVYCEAAFYDLAYAGQISEREYRQTLPGDALTDALAGTGWKLATVNVSTRRTYTIEDRSTPLEMLRAIQSNHGGDLVFNNRARTVSLLVRSGADAGVSFLYGRGLTESQRVVDTTSLVTRHLRAQRGRRDDRGRERRDARTWRTSPTRRGPRGHVQLRGGHVALPNALDGQRDPREPVEAVVLVRVHRRRPVVPDRPGGRPVRRRGHRDRGR